MDTVLVQEALETGTFYEWQCRVDLYTNMGEKLIEAVRKEKCLYDVKHPDYVKVKLKDSIWKRIAEELSLKDGNAARKAWERLRNNHRDALRRQKNVKRKSVSGDNIRPWRYQELMAFLIPHMGNRTTKTNILEGSQHDEPSQTHSDSTENEINDKIKDNYEYQTSTEESNHSLEPSSTGTSTLTGRVHKIRRFKRKKSNVLLNKSIEGRCS